MNDPVPHYLLVSGSDDSRTPERWRFILRSVDGFERFGAEDSEPGVRGERLELFALVRGLEALDQPSRVTLLTRSRYIRMGIRRGLPEWRSNGWQWECFGRMVPVKNRDLWQRVDRALDFHRLECRTLRLDDLHDPFPAPSGGRSRRPYPRWSEPAGDSAGWEQGPEADLDWPDGVTDRRQSRRSWRNRIQLGNLFGLGKLLT